MLTAEEFKRCIEEFKPVGFSTQTQFSGDVYLECHGKMINMDNSEEFDLVYYPLFLQRVIEGINMKSDELDLSIIQNRHEIRVVNWEYGLLEYYNCDENGKEQAIKYILELGIE